MVLAAFALSSCGTAHQGSPGSGAGSSFPAPHAAAGTEALATGPGPQPAYRVQPQPVDYICRYRHTADKQPLPDPACTPGSRNPRVDQSNIGSTICRTGYTAGIRPPTSITGREKEANAKSYGYTGSLHDAEYDHLVSLELGGDPNDPRNLWVEPPSPGHRPGSGPGNTKDGVESTLHNAVCAHRTTLKAAQLAIAHDWTTAESTLGLTKKRSAD